ncbi:MAG: DUF2721 domain-containing protein [Planctomycetota bacterium]
MTDATGIIQDLVAPAILIPACGLLLLSSTARMNTVLARIRAFHRERLDVWRDDPAPGSRDEGVRNLRLEGLERQTTRLIARAALLRATMIQLFAAIICNLLSVFGLAAPYVVGESAVLLYASVIVFLLGIAAMLGAMATSVLEVARILETVHYEHDRVESLCGTPPPDDPGPVHPLPGMGEGMGL